MNVNAALVGILSVGQHPVQAMDPATVEGLAKVLHETAVHRQVIVFTHDDRLADALRRLMLPTTILEVVRREGSKIEIEPNLDPLQRYLADARHRWPAGTESPRPRPHQPTPQPCRPPPVALAGPAVVP